MDSYQLPFELTTKAATDWLHSISHLKNINSASQLNKAIKQLKLIDKQEKLVLDILLLMTSTVLSTCSTIELSLATDRGIKATAKSRKIEKLCNQLLKQFSLTISHLTCKKSFTTENQQDAIYIALQTIGFSQRLSATLHQPPSSSLWKKTGELYFLAQNKSILSQEIKHQIKEFNNQSTIESVIKRNLLFSIFAPYQCPPIQINTLFLFTQQHSNILGLNTSKTKGCHYLWNPLSHAPPHQDCEQKEVTALNIDTSKTLALCQSTSLSSHIDKKTLSHMVNQLTGHEELINTVLPSMLDINHYFIGLPEISDFLTTISKLNKIQLLSSQYTEYQPEDPLFTTPASFEKSTSSSSSKENLLEEAKSTKILQTKDDTFIVAETNKIDCHIGETFLICKSVNSFELGIIRQLRTTNQSGTIHILIEKITGIPSLLQIETPEIPGRCALIIQNEHSSPILILPPCKLSIGSEILSSSGKSYFLDKLIDYNAYGMHYLTNE